MSILTHMMKTAKDDNRGANCKMWMPFNEGSGTSFGDLAGGISSQVDGSAAHTIANTVTMGVANTTETQMPTIGEKVWVLVYMEQVVQSVSFCTMSMGTGSASDQKISVTESFAAVDEGATIYQTTASSSASVGNDVFVAATSDLSTLTHYRGINGGTVAAVNTVDITASGNNIVFDDSSSVLIGSTAFRQHVYGVALFAFSDGLPSDLVEGLQWMQDQWLQGHKTIYPGWKNLA